MPQDFCAQVERFIATHRLLARGARVVVAVSGGADSVALLHVLSVLQPAWRFVLRVAHLDHGLRPDSAEDAAFVQELASRYRLPSVVERRDVSALCRRRGWSLEEGARRIRYEFLLEATRRDGADAVAVAHTADDQAETVLLRLLRGTGLTGLAAMAMARPMDGNRLVRPLLEVWRRDLAAFLEEEGLAYRDDPSNADERFVRNRIRHELLPLLERRYNPRIKQALVQLAEQCRADDAFLQEAAERQWKRLVKPMSPGSDFEAYAEKSSGATARLAIAVPAFLRQPGTVQRQLVRRAIQRVRGDLREFEYRHWLQAEQLFRARPAGTKLDLPGGVQLTREKDRVVCQRTEHTPLDV